jgi:hypothetical protein
MKKGMIVSHLWRTGKRTVVVAFIGLTVALLVVPETSLAAAHKAPGGIQLIRPADGVGDSPIMP